MSRHHVRLTAIDRDSPLSEGNGEFAFTADVTGLQSLPGTYEKSTPLSLPHAPYAGEEKR